MNDELTKEIIEAIEAQKRPEKIEAPIYGLYDSEEFVFIYSDKEQKYSVKKQHPENKKVRSIKAFSDAIKEELKRRGNTTGQKATVQINLTGGLFIPDDNYGGYQIDYERLNSQQWLLLQKYINLTVNHKNFLLFLKSLKPSFELAGVDFQEIFKSYCNLRIVGNSQLVSNPIMDESGQRNEYKCVYRLENGTDSEMNFPSDFTVKIPFAKAGMFQYDINIELLFARNEDDELEITILCPEFENITERAVIDEAEYIKNRAKDYTDLLVLSDF